MPFFALHQGLAGSDLGGWHEPSADRPNGSARSWLRSTPRAEREDRGSKIPLRIAFPTLRSVHLRGGTARTDRSSRGPKLLSNRGQGLAAEQHVDAATR